MAAERGLELRGIRHHEAELRVVIGELALQIEEIGAGHMAGLKTVAARHDDIGHAAAGRLIVKRGGAIEDAQVRLAEDLGEFRR